MLSNICVPPGSLEWNFPASQLSLASLCLPWSPLSAPAVAAFWWVCTYNVMPEPVDFIFIESRLPLEFTWARSQEKRVRTSKPRLEHQSALGASETRGLSAGCSLHAKTSAPWAPTQSNREACVGVGQPQHPSDFWTENIKGHPISDCRLPLLAEHGSGNWRGQRGLLGTPAGSAGGALPAA